METPPDLSEPKDDSTGKRNVKTLDDQQVSVNAVYYGEIVPQDEQTQEWTAFEVIAYGEKVFETDTENPNWEGWYYAKQHAIGFAEGYIQAVNDRDDEAN